MICNIGQTMRFQRWVKPPKRKRYKGVKGMRLDTKYLYPPCPDCKKNLIKIVSKEIKTDPKMMYKFHCRECTFVGYVEVKHKFHEMKIMLQR